MCVHPPGEVLQLWEIWSWVFWRGHFEVSGKHYDRGASILISWKYFLEIMIHLYIYASPDWKCLAIQNTNTENAHIGEIRKCIVLTSGVKIKMHQIHSDYVICKVPLQSKHWLSHCCYPIVWLVCGVFYCTGIRKCIFLTTGIQIQIDQVYSDNVILYVCKVNISGHTAVVHLVWLVCGVLLCRRVNGRLTRRWPCWMRCRIWSSEPACWQDHCSVLISLPWIPLQYVSLLTLTALCQLVGLIFKLDLWPPVLVLLTVILMRLSWLWADTETRCIGNQCGRRRLSLRLYEV